MLLVVISAFWFLVAVRRKQRAEYGAGREQSQLLHRSVQYSTVQYGAAQQGQYSTVQYSTVQYSTVRQDSRSFRSLKLFKLVIFYDDDKHFWGVTMVQTRALLV